MERFSVLQRLSFFGIVALLLLVGAGVYTFFISMPREQAFYTPGTVPSRDDCFYGKLAQFKNVTRQIIFQAAQECEIEVQSLEGHEQKRLEWIERQAERARQRVAEPQPAAVPEEPKEKDTVRRVWR
ncbi:MAG: hypothetical protein OJJ21_13090 [Ferrovibrio sp.]|uniref:hypothetical protein n=1 Tax=Ferrovibrio sp. TaxID=1917215 RepID=UPI002621A204|nr:hypothetical protein [Ferrovibrio sp.]MCW0234529.1 hypothetical protein [Ferrovibrio sp.]